jgi:hypothetical protein
VTLRGHVTVDMFTNYASDFNTNVAAFPVYSVFFPSERLTGIYLFQGIVYEFMRLLTLHS